MIRSKFELIISVQHTLLKVISAIERLIYLLSWQASQLWLQRLCAELRYSKVDRAMSRRHFIPFGSHWPAAAAHLQLDASKAFVGLQDPRLSFVLTLAIVGVGLGTYCLIHYAPHRWVVKTSRPHTFRAQLIRPIACMRD